MVKILQDPPIKNPGYANAHSRGISIRLSVSDYMHVNQPTNMIYYALGCWLQGSSSEKVTAEETTARERGGEMTNKLLQYTGCQTLHGS